MSAEDTAGRDFAEAGGLVEQARLEAGISDEKWLAAISRRDAARYIEVGSTRMAARLDALERRLVALEAAREADQ